MTSSPTLADFLPQPESMLAPNPAVRPTLAPDAPVILSASDLYKTYRKGEYKTPVLQGVNFDVRQGEFVAIVGQSGSGKSTLLHLLGTLDKPDAGEVYFEGHRIDNLPGRARTCSATATWA